MKKDAGPKELAKTQTLLEAAQRRFRAAAALSKSLKERTRVSKLKAKEARKEWKQARKHARLALADEEIARKQLRAAEKRFQKSKSKGKSPPPPKRAKAPKPVAKKSIRVSSFARTKEKPEVVVAAQSVESAV